MIPKNNDSNQPINEQIRFPRVQLITHEGNNVGVVTRDEALKLARTVGLDLVLVSETGKDNVPVVKIIDFGKLLYAKKKKLAEAKKHQKVIQIKEIKIRPKIGEHDFQTKMKQAVQFLQEGKHVKVTLVFRGREAALSHEHGIQLFQKIDEIFTTEGLSIMHDKETRSGGFWSKIYAAKSSAPAKSK